MDNEMEELKYEIKQMDKQMGVYAHTLDSFARQVNENFDDVRRDINLIKMILVIMGVVILSMNIWGRVG